VREATAGPLGFSLWSAFWKKAVTKTWLQATENRGRACSDPESSRAGSEVTEVAVPIRTGPVASHADPSDRCEFEDPCPSRSPVG
jgi:hypothetical protein